eukprot:15460586-Alexandrium_andersonii.AAC.1
MHLNWAGPSGRARADWAGIRAECGRGLSGRPGPAPATNPVGASGFQAAATPVRRASAHRHEANLSACGHRSYRQGVA